MLKIDQIYQMDCFDFFKKIDDQSVDLAIVDPPYFLKKAEWDTFKSHENFLNFTFAWIDALLPKLKNTASLYIFNTPYNAAYILTHLIDKKMIFQNWIVWDKRDGMSAAKRKYTNGQETILFFTKGDDYIFNVDDIRVPYESTERMEHAKKVGILKNGKRWFPNPAGKLCGEIWHFSSERHKNKLNGKTQKMSHLTPKPLDMIERMVLASSNKGGLVLDCFMGSGTTAVAAKKFGRHFIGCDKDKKYVAATNNRLKKY